MKTLDEIDKQIQTMSAEISKLREIRAEILAKSKADHNRNKAAEKDRKTKARDAALELIHRQNITQEQAAKIAGCSVCTIISHVKRKTRKFEPREFGYFVNHRLGVKEIIRLIYEPELMERMKKRFYDLTQDGHSGYSMKKEQFADLWKP